MDEDALRSEIAQVVVVLKFKGMSAASSWIDRRLTTYEQAIADPNHCGSREPFRSEFEASIEALQVIQKIFESGYVEDFLKSEGITFFP